jgi:hypothetical protein
MATRVRLEQARSVHRGPIFEVLRGVVGEREVAVKCRVPGPPGAAIASTWHHWNCTNIFVSAQFGWRDGEPPPDEPFLDELLTTNAAHYLLVEPEAGPGPPQLCAPINDLRQLLEGLTGHLFQRWFQIRSSGSVRQASPPPAPSVADVIACGAIYFGVLAGTALASQLGITAPLWTGLWSDWGDRPTPPLHSFDLLVPGALSRVLRATGATAAECTLCEHLVLANLDEESVTRHVADALRSLEKL